MGTLDVGRVADVIVGVNRSVRALWSTPELAWFADKTLRNMIHKCAQDNQDLVASAGPLRYGLMCVGDQWEWLLAISPDNYQRVPLEARQILKDAADGGLSDEWQKHPHRAAVLQRRLRMASLTSPDDVLGWFDRGLHELHEARILDRFIAVLATRAAGRAEGEGVNG
jgi:hypothetical protein